MIKNKPSLLLLAFSLTISISNHTLADIPKNQLAIEFTQNEMTLSERLALINTKLKQINPNLPKPLKIDYVNYYDTQYHIIITPNQPINIDNAVTELTNEVYIIAVKAVGAIVIY